LIVVQELFYDSPSSVLICDVVDSAVLITSVTKFETESVELPCHTTSPFAVDWLMRNGAGTRRIYVTSTEDITTGFKKDGRHSVTVGGGFYNLTIQRLNIGDTADYVCTEYTMLAGGSEQPSESSVHLSVAGTKVIHYTLLLFNKTEEN